MPATSINMHADTNDRILCAAGRLGVSRRELVVRLLMRIMRDVASFHRRFRNIRYQSDDAGGHWHCFAIRFTPEETEFFSDLRNVCKCSVSLLVAIAVEKYLDEMLGDIKKEVYNYYQFNGYEIHMKQMNGTITWTIQWKPPKTIALHRLE